MAVAGIGGIGPFDSAKMAEAIFKKIDANGDGSLDKSEIQAATKGRIGPSPELILSKFDTNHDDKLSEAEFKDSLKKMGGPGGTGPKGGMPPGGMGRMPPGGAPPSGGKSGSSDMNVYDKKDLNKDGIVTYQEKIEYALQHPEEKTESHAEANDSNNTHNDNLAITHFIRKLQSGMKYGQQGNLGVNASGIQNRFDITA